MVSEGRGRQGEMVPSLSPSSSAQVQKRENGRQPINAVAVSELIHRDKFTQATSELFFSVGVSTWAVTVGEGGEPPFRLSTSFFSFVASGNSAPQESCTRSHSALQVV